MLCRPQNVIQSINSSISGTAVHVLQNFRVILFSRKVKLSFFVPDCNHGANPQSPVTTSPSVQPFCPLLSQVLHRRR